MQAALLLLLLLFSTLLVGAIVLISTRGCALHNLHLIIIITMSEESGRALENCGVYSDYLNFEHA